MLDEELLWFGIHRSTTIPSWYHLLLLLMLYKPVLRHGSPSLRTSLTASARIDYSTFLATLTIMVISTVTSGRNRVLSRRSCLVR